MQLNGMHPDFVPKFISNSVCFRNDFEASTFKVKAKASGFRDVEAMAMARLLRGQGQGHDHDFLVFELSLKRSVLENPILDLFENEVCIR